MNGKHNREAELAGSPAKLSLGNWLPDQRGLPKYITNASIFRVIPKGGKRRVLNLERVAVREKRGEPEFEILMSGMELSQADCDVWIELCHLANMEGKSIVHVGVRELLRSIGRDESGKAMRQLRDSLRYMQHAQIILMRELKRFGSNLPEGERDTLAYVREYGSSLILRYGIDDEGLTVQLDSNIAKLFKGYTYHVSHELRKSLSSHMTKFVLGFVTSDDSNPNSPNRVTVPNLHAMSGSRAKLPNFVKQLRGSLRQLKAVGVLASWELNSKNDGGRIVKNAVLKYALTKQHGQIGTGWHHASVQSDLKRTRSGKSAIYTMYDHYSDGLPF